MTALNWGILGTGNIARTFAEGIAASQTGTLVDVGSRTPETAERFGAAFGLDRRRCYPSYEALLADPRVQAVYISLPNHLHAEWTIKCAAAGKHVLCEKPLTVNHAEAVGVIEAVQRHNVFLMEAFMYRCHPQTARLQELLGQRVIGEVRLIESSFCYNMGPQYDNIRLSNAAAGGGIMDVGCYPASMSRLIAGAEPTEVKGAAHIGPRSRVDEQAVASLLFPGGVVASLACATQVELDQELRIWGASGHIRVPNPWKPVAGANRIVVHRDGQTRPDEIVVEGGAPLYAIEADTVAQAIAAGHTQSPRMSWDDSLGNMALLDAWRQSVGLRFDHEASQYRRIDDEAL